MLLKLSIFDFYGQRSDRKIYCLQREGIVKITDLVDNLSRQDFFFTSEMQKNIHVAITQQMRISLLFPLNRFSSFHFNVMGIYSVFRLGRELKCSKRVSSHINVIKFQHKNMILHTDAFPYQMVRNLMTVQGRWRSLLFGGQDYLRERSLNLHKIRFRKVVQVCQIAVILLFFRNIFIHFLIYYTYCSIIITSKSKLILQFIYLKT